MLVAACALAPVDATSQTYLVVVSGIGGEPRYSKAFHEWSATLIKAARDRYGLPPASILYLAESAAGDPSITGKSTKENIVRTLDDLAHRVEPDARIFIVLIGHGSAVGGTSRFNLPGPDITAEELAGLLSRFSTQELVLVNLTSASGGFIPVLSSDRRTIVTATKSGFERNETIFAGHFVDAFVSEGADVDKDERVSVLEAFNYARHEVARAYESEQRLLTEHALLDDNGDGKGSTEPDPQTTDGARAMRLFLDDVGGRSPRTVSGDPELDALYEEKQTLEERIAALRVRKDQIVPETYERELEQLLIQLARTSRAIREREEKEPR